MKLFKSSILLASAVAMSVAFSACSDSKFEDFEPGGESAGLFFPSNAPSSIDLTKASESFSVTVSRSGITDAASYPIVVTTTAPEGVFEVPTSVSFGQGEESTSIIVKCNLAEQPADSKYSFSFKLGDGVPAYNYGNTTCNLTVAIPAAWSAWQKYDKGICTWFYDLGFIKEGPDPDLPISYRRNLEVEGQGQFLIEHWRQDVPLYIDYDQTNGYCYIPFDTPTGVKINVSGAGVLDEYVSDAYTYMLSIGKPNSDLLGASTFDEEKGLFEMYVVYYVYNPATGRPALLEGSDGFERCQVGAFKDYSVALKYDGVFTAVNEATFAQLTTTVGADCSDAKVMISNTMTAQQIMEAIVGGDANAVSVAPGTQKAQLPISEAGKYTGVIVSFDGDEAQNAAAIEFNVVLGATSSQDWVTMSTGMIVDGWITAAWKFTGADGQPLTYEDLPWTFEMQKHKTQEGVYRMKAPYTQAECALVQIGINENASPYNLVIDARNPQLVIMEPQASGFATTKEKSFEGLLIPQDDYQCFIGNLAGYAVAMAGWSEQQIIDKGWNDTFLEDGIIYFTNPVFGSSEDFGYSWNSKPQSMIALDINMEQAPAKKINKMLDLRAKAKVAEMMSIKKNINLNEKFFSNGLNLNKAVRLN